jgi:hypothetical protein
MAGVGRPRHEDPFGLVTGPYETPTLATIAALSANDFNLAIRSLGLTFPRRTARATKELALHGFLVTRDARRLPYAGIKVGQNGVTLPWR